MQQTIAPKEPAGVGVEISTEQLKQILANKSEPVVDVRTPKEYAIAHIPGSIHIYEKDLEKLMQLLPDKKAGMVIYCNGPYCHKVKRVGEQLFKRGYTNIKRYQLGMPVWRAYGNTVQTDMAGCQYIFPEDKTAVWVDARPKEEFAKGTVPGAVNVQAGEVKVANEDGRLPYTDKGTRIVVFADNPEMARKVAEEIAHTAFWNSSYFGGTFADLRAAGLW
ncbi:MAG: rhodanese-like domain-containing protein [Geobacteraceae bacterium]|jgi:rhodanese-related sulfurtransferase